MAGWFLGGPVADRFGRRVGMAVGCFLIIIATFLQAFAPYHNIGCFIGGRVLIGLGQGMALSQSSPLPPFIHARYIDLAERVTDLLTSDEQLPDRSILMKFLPPKSEVIS